VVRRARLHQHARACRGNGTDALRECRHPGALWLAALVSDCVSQQDITRALRSQGDDRRALFLLGRLTFREELVQRSAEMGYAPSQARFNDWREDGDEEAFSWAEKAVSQGDRWGAWRLAGFLAEGRGCERDQAKALALWRQAAELGHGASQYCLGTHGYGPDDWQRYLWWGRAVVRGSWQARSDLIAAARRELESLDAGCGRGRVMFEIGAAHSELLKKETMMATLRGDEVELVQRCAALFEKSVALARSAIGCGLAATMRLGLVHDVRRVVRRLLWQERAAWCKGVL
jgi:hypothetical protein